LSQETDTIFSPKQLQRFQKHKRMVKKMQLHHVVPGNLHVRGYDKGDLRCVRCLKWIDVTGLRYPEESKLIWYGKRGKRHHFRCPVYATYPATLAMVSRQKRRVVNGSLTYRTNETAKRY
jgi:hypothetical protein